MTNKRALACFLALLLPAVAMAQDNVGGRIVISPLPDSVLHKDTTVIRRPSFFKRVGRTFINFVNEFNNIDTNYIEPQHYNYTVMLQNTWTYEAYRLYNRKTDHSFTFSPDVGVRMGPYFGYRWAFLGYTVDLRHVSGSEGKKELALSLYSSLLGIDLYYRKTGNDYKLKRANLGNNINADALRDIPFSGFKADIRGFNAYYIFNHRRFSYPAAYSQSTCQKRSSGSAIAGFGYTRQKINVDRDALEGIIKEKIPSTEKSYEIDSTLQAGKVDYTDFSFSGGYAYNWVFARNWLLDITIQAALAYKRTKSDSRYDRFSLRNFKISNFNLDGVTRIGLVWNNTRWYAGMNAIVHAYNYNKHEFGNNSIFGSANIYFGYNFGLRKEYKRPHP